MIVVLIIIFLSIVSVLFYTYKAKEKYNNIIVPLKIYTHWNTKDLPDGMKENLANLKKDNPEFDIILYDNIAARDFISKYFDKEILNAFDCLIPHSYKSDLFRYCILYVYGGIYLDIKFKCVNNFKFINMVDKEYWIQDLKKDRVLTGLLIRKTRDPILLKCIKKIVFNVRTKFYGRSCLHPTGPYLLGDFFTQNEKDNMEYILKKEDDKTLGIINKKTKLYILKYYDGYRDDQRKIENKENTKYYSDSWSEKNIYCNK